MSYDLNISAVAALIAEPARAAMLAALLDGRALPAGELAYACGVTPQTASAHLAKLLHGNLVAVETEGRHRYYRLASADVAEAMERLGAIRREQPVRRKPLGRAARQLQWARCCYNHLAGQLGIAVAHRLEVGGFIVPAANKQYDITSAGADWFAGIGLDVCSLKPTRRGVARQCLDWTERRHHLAGPLGVELLNVLCSNDWLRRTRDSRAVRVTALGRRELKRRLGVEMPRDPGNAQATT